MMSDEMILRIRISLAGLVLLVLVASWDGRAFAQGAQPNAPPGMQPGVLWLFGLGLGQGYDDDPFGTGQGGDFAQYNPDLTLRQDKKHGFWLLDLQSSVQQFYNFAITDRFNESASTIDSWQISRRWTFDLNGNYLHSSDPLAPTQGTGEAQPVGSPNVVSPNSAFIGPQSPFTVFGGSSTVQYQAGRYTGLTFGGDYFSSRENAPGLPNTTSQALRAGYTRMVQRGQSVGLDYSAQFFSVVNPSENITTNTLLLSYNFEWKTGRQIALFGGPQYSSLSGNLAGTVGSPSVLTGVTQQVLSYAAGASLSLRISQQDFFQLMASRRVAGSGGVSGAGIQDEGQLGLSRRFTKRFSASTGGFYSEYQALGNLPVVQPNSWGTFNSAQFNFAPNSSVSVEYDYFHQTLLASSLAPLFSHNRALIEYRYSFGTLHRGR
jgi:hypothetical protein